jgi:spermidine/putrescine transport system substrate-binding protein
MKKVLLIATLLLAATNAAAADEEVLVYNWTEYIPDNVLSRFEAETGIEVVYTTYESNEAMYAKVKMLGGKGYDVIFPSSYFVSRMRNEGLLLPLDKSRLPNLRHLDPELLDKAYDPGNRYSIPYLVGTTAIGVSLAAVDPQQVTTYRELWKPIYRDKVTLTDDLREVFGMALLVLGYSLNSTEENHIREAYQLLVALKPNILVFNSDAPRMPFLNGEAIIGLVWGGEVHMANQEMGEPVLGYVYPREGPMPWVDSMVIPVGAANVTNAHAFIDFIMRPVISRQICEAIGFATPNLAARRLLPATVRNDPVVFPPPGVMRTAEFARDLGPDIAIYEKYWEKLKAGQ